MFCKRKKKELLLFLDGLIINFMTRKKLGENIVIVPNSHFFLSVVLSRFPRTTHLSHYTVQSDLSLPIAFPKEAEMLSKSHKGH